MKQGFAVNGKDALLQATKLKLTKSHQDALENQHFPFSCK